MRQMLIRTHMHELKFRTEAVLYERYRTERKLGVSGDNLSDGQVGYNLSMIFYCFIIWHSPLMMNIGR